MYLANNERNLSEILNVGPIFNIFPMNLAFCMTLHQVISLLFLGGMQKKTKKKPHKSFARRVHSSFFIYFGIFVNYISG